MQTSTIDKILTPGSLAFLAAKLALFGEGRRLGNEFVQL